MKSKISSLKEDAESNPVHRLSSVISQTNKEPSPIFILGQPRSGTTLLQRLINSTGLATVYGEHLGILRGIAESYIEFFGNEELSKFCQFHDGPQHETITIAALRNPKVFSALINGFSSDRIKDCYRNFIRGLIDPCEIGMRWGFKEVRYCAGRDFVVPFLRDMFPNCQMVFTIRDPVRQVKSVLQSGWWKHTPGQAASLWTAQTRGMLQYCRDYPKHTILARYEDIVSRNEKAVREIFSWLHIPYGSKQRAILFRTGKVGATPKGKRLPKPTENAILNECSFPEGRVLYPSVVSLK